MVYFGFVEMAGKPISRSLVRRQLDEVPSSTNSWYRIHWSRGPTKKGWMMKRLGLHRLYLVLGAALLILMLAVAPAFASVMTDQDDYSPGSTVTISGNTDETTPYLAGETVVVDVVGPNGYAAHAEAVVGEDGNWAAQVVLWDDSRAEGAYSYTAVGQTSGVSETGAFTDNVNDAAVYVEGAGPEVATFSFTVDWYKYSNTTATGTPTKSGTVTVYVINGVSVGFPVGQLFSGSESVKLVAASNSSASIPFAGWLADDSQSPLGKVSGFKTSSHVISNSGSTICLTGYRNNAFPYASQLLYPKAVYSAIPVVNAAADQKSQAGVTHTFALGEFADSGGTSWKVDVAWGDTNSEVQRTVLSTGSLGTAAHSYASPGSYQVEVKVTDEAGQIGTDTFWVTVYDQSPQVTAAADQTASQRVAKDFNIGSFWDESGTSWSANIDWGDGSPDTDLSSGDPTPAIIAAQNHTFNGQGDFTVTVSVTDSDMNTGSDTFNVLVFNKPPSATFDPALTGASCGGSLIVAPTVVATDGAGDLPTDPNDAIYKIRVPLDDIMPALPTLNQIVTDPAAWDELKDLFTSSFLTSILGSASAGLPHGITLDWNVVTDPTTGLDTGTGTFGGTARVQSGVYLLWVIDKSTLGGLSGGWATIYSQISAMLLGGGDFSDLGDLQPLVMVVLPKAEISPKVSVGQYSDPLINPATITVTAGIGDAHDATTVYKYFPIGDIAGLAGQIGDLAQQQLGNWDLNEFLSGITIPADEILSGFQSGLPAGLSLTFGAETVDDGLATATGTVTGNITDKPGLYLVAVKDRRGAPAIALWTVIELPKDAFITVSDLTGTWTSTSTANLIANVKVPIFGPADSTPGVMGNMWVRFQIRDPFTNQQIGDTRWAQVSTAGCATGYGKASVTVPAKVPDGIYFIVADLVKANSSNSANEYYWALPGWGSYSLCSPATGKMLTGGGWFTMTGTQSGLTFNADRANVGISAKYNKSGSLQGSAIIVCHGIYMGQDVNVIVKSNALSALTVVGTAAPYTATLTGKASMQIATSIGAVQLYGKGSLTMTLKAVDTNSTSSPDSYTLIVKDGTATVLNIPVQLLKGGNFTIHAK